MSNENKENININFYSRQIAALGVQNLLEIRKIKVLLIGIGGLGSEIAKNLILTGIEQLSIYDEKICEFKDFSSNFFIKKSDIESKLTRQEACLNELKKLNEDVKVEIHKINPYNKPENLKNFDIVIVSELTSKKNLIKLNKFLRENNIGFILGISAGLFSYIFIDYCPNFKIKNIDGMEAQEYFIQNIELIKEERNHYIIDISNEKLFSEENKKSIFFLKKKSDIKEDSQQINIIEIIDDFKIKIKTDLPRESLINKRIIEDKQKLYIDFKSLDFCLENFSKMRKANLLDKNIHENMHVNLLSLIEILENITYEKNEKNFELLLQKKIKENFEQKFKNFLQLTDLTDIFCKTALTNVPNISTYLGSILAFEILKFHGKYQPINQWFRFDFKYIYSNEKLDKKLFNLNIEEKTNKLCIEVNKHSKQDEKFNINNLNYQNVKTIQNNNILKNCDSIINENEYIYEDLIKIFGKNLFNSLSNLNVFLIGAGAIGCEYLKLLSQMGVATNTGCIHVTDMDYIELSNLNRQFLFDKNSIKQNKAKIASEKIKAKNPYINVIPYDLEVSEKTEDFFDEEFWKNLDLILIAVDNVKARLYIDKKLIEYKIKTIESGLKGIEGNCQIIIPDKTISYSDNIIEEVQEENSCTLSAFPKKKEHVIRWATEIIFEKYFNNYVEEIKIAIEDEKAYLGIFNRKNSLSEKCLSLIFLKLYIQLIKKKIKINIVGDIMFELFFFYDVIKSKESAQKNENVELKKKMEQVFPVHFDYKNNLHYQFSNAISQILNKCLNFESLNKISLTQNGKSEAEIFEELNIKNNFIKDIISLENLSEESLNNLSHELYEEFLKSISEFKNSLKFKYLRITPQIFDKDSEDEKVLVFIYYCSLIKAKIFNIEEFDIIKTKIIAGKIGPVIPHICSCITGFASSNIYNILKHDYDNIYNYNFNLGNNLAQAYFPTNAISIEKGLDNNLQREYIARPKKFSKWDRLCYSSPIILKEFLEIITKEYSVKILLVDCENYEIYSIFDYEEKELCDTIEDIYFRRKEEKKQHNKKVLRINIECEDLKNERLIIRIPTIEYLLFKKLLVI